MTRDDLDELSDSAYDAAEPAEVAAQLAAAADSGMLADRGDAGHAYLLAAEIYERVDDLPAALAMAERALATGRGGEAGATRAFRAELLLRLGRERDAMDELSSLRPAMTEDPLAAAYVPEALAGGGYGQRAVEWLDHAIAQRGGGADDPVTGQLIATRGRLGDGDEPDKSPDFDDADDVADRDGSTDRDDFTDRDEVTDRDGLTETSSGSGSEPSEAVLLVWPQPDYELVDERWPEVLEATGAEDWDDYRRRQQALIMSWTRRHRSLWLVCGSADGFADFLEDQQVDLASDDLAMMADRYGDLLMEQTDPVPLPPAPADECWCGSHLPYSRCCQLLSPAR